jgi:hypothetical protein
MPVKVQGKGEQFVCCLGDRHPLLTERQQDFAGFLENSSITRSIYRYYLDSSPQSL